MVTIYGRSIPSVYMDNQTEYDRQDTFDMTSDILRPGFGLVFERIGMMSPQVEIAYLTLNIPMQQPEFLDTDRDK